MLKIGYVRSPMKSVQRTCAGDRIQRVTMKRVDEIPVFFGRFAVRICMLIAEILPGDVIV